MKKEQTFWLVWNSDRHNAAPTHKHYSKATAEQEAERLSRCNPAETFVVLKAVSAVKSQPKYKWSGFRNDPDFDEIPF